MASATILHELSGSHLVADKYSVNVWKKLINKPPKIHHFDHYYKPTKKPEHFYIEQLQHNLQGMMDSKDDYHTFKSFKKYFKYYKWYYTFFYGAINNNIDSNEFQNERQSPPIRQVIPKKSEKISNPRYQQCTSPSSLNNNGAAVEINADKQSQEQLNELVINHHKYSNNAHQNHEEFNKNQNSSSYKSPSANQEKSNNAEKISNNPAWSERLKRIQHKIGKNGKPNRKSEKRYNNKIAAILEFENLTII